MASKEQIATIILELATAGLGGLPAISQLHSTNQQAAAERRRQEEAERQAERQARMDKTAAQTRDEGRRAALAKTIKDLPEAHAINQINLPRPGSTPGQGPGGITLPEVASGPAGSMDLMKQLFGGFETEDPTGALASTRALADVEGASDAGALARSIQEEATRITELARPRAEAAVLEEEITRPAKIETEVQSDLAGYEMWEKKALVQHGLRLQEQIHSESLARASKSLEGDDPAEFGYSVASDLAAIAPNADLSTWNRIVREELREAFPNASDAEIGNAASKALKTWDEHLDEKSATSRRTGSTIRQAGSTAMSYKEARQAFDREQQERLKRAGLSGSVQGGGSTSASTSVGEVFDPSQMSEEELRRMAQ